MNRLLLIPALLLAGLFSAADAYANSELYQRQLHSSVWILQPAEGGRVSSGSGTLIDARRRLVSTNHHVVDYGEKVIVFFPIVKDGRVVQDRETYLREGEKIPGRVVAKDASKDLALIQLDRLPSSAREVKLADRSAQPGEAIHLIGNGGAVGAHFAYIRGYVRAVAHMRYGMNSGNQIDALIVSTDLAANPGDSGSGVFNDKGELIGVIHANGKGNTVARAIDVSELKVMYADFVNGQSGRPEITPVVNSGGRKSPEDWVLGPGQDFGPANRLPGDEPAPAPSTKTAYRVSISNPYQLPLKYALQVGGGQWKVFTVQPGKINLHTYTVTGDSPTVKVAYDADLGDPQTLQSYQLRVKEVNSETERGAFYRFRKVDSQRIGLFTETPAA